MLNFYGINDGEGIGVFVDGVEKARDDTKNTRTYRVIENRATIGWNFKDRPKAVEIDVDELLFFNKHLSPLQVKILSNNETQCSSGNRCQNGGTYEAGLFPHECVCAEGFSGSYCESQIEESPSDTTERMTINDSTTRDPEGASSPKQSICGNID